MANIEECDECVFLKEICDLEEQKIKLDARIEYLSDILREIIDLPSHSLFSQYSIEEKMDRIQRMASSGLKGKW
jgi:hypothetical protein